MRAEVELLDRQVKFKEGEEQRIRGVIADYQRRIEAVPGLESEWIALSRDYDTQQQAYKELLSKSENSKVAANLERRQIGEQFRVLDPPRVPGRAVSPVRIQITAIGIGLGLLIGFGLAAFNEMRDSSFRSERDVVTALGLPVVAIIPYLDTVEDQRQRRQRRIVTSLAVMVLATTGGYVFWTMQLWRYVA
jgi:hypothetical protein